MKVLGFRARVQGLGIWGLGFGLGFMFPDSGSVQGAPGPWEPLEGLGAYFLGPRLRVQ